MNLFELAAVLILDHSAYDSGLSDAEKKAVSFGSAMKSGLSTVAKVSAAAIGTASTAVVAFGKSSVDAGMVFDSSMSQVAATMGTTVDQIQNLRDYAQEMGAKTAFSASQAADAMNYMALAGYDAETTMEMLPNVLNLAAAGGIELAYASDMITDSQSALGLSLDETAELVDKMAKASSKSNTSVQQLGEAILTVGGTAKTLSGGTTELSTALGILADNGVKGAEGGTALRNIILSLSAPTDTAADAMESLGLNAFDADGNLRPLNETFDDLNSALSSMTQGEQTKVLNKIFNKVDLKSVNALLANTIGSFENIEDAIQDTGVNWEKYDVSAEAALQNAAYMLESLGLSAEEAQKQLSLEMNIDAADALATVNVAFEELNKGAFTTKTRFDELSGYIDGAWYSIESLDKALKETGSISLSQMQTNLKKLGVTSEEFTAALDASGGVAEVFAEEIWAAADATASNEELSNAMSASLGELQKAFDNTTGAAQAMADTQLDNLSGDITLFQSALEGAQIAVSDKLTPTLRQFVQFGADGISKLTDAFKEGGLTGAMDALGGVLGDGIAMIGDMLPDIVGAGVNLIDALVDGLTKNIKPLTDAAMKIVMKLIEGIGKTLPKLVTAGLDIIKTLAQGVAENTETIVKAVVDVTMQVAQALTNPETLNAIATAAVQIMNGLANGIKEAIPKLKETLPTIIQNIVDFFTTSLPLLVEAGLGLIVALGQGLLEALPTLVDKLPTIILNIVNFLISSIPMIIDAGVKLLSALVEDLPTIVGKLAAAIPTIVSGIASAVTGNIDQIIRAGIELFVALIAATPEIIGGIVAAIPEIINGIVDGFMSFLGSFNDVGKNLISGLWQGFESMGEWLGEKIFSFFDNVINGIKNFLGIHSPSTVFAGMGENLIAGLWEGIKGMGDWIGGKVSGFFGGIVDGIKNMLGIHSPSTVFAEMGENMALGIGKGFDDEFSSIRDSMNDQMDFTANADVNVNKNGAFKGGYGTNGEITSAEKQPLTVIVQLSSGVELGRALIDNINQAKRVDGLVY